MGDKIKFVIIGLTGLLLASIVIILQVNSSKQVLERKVIQLNKVESDNAALRKKLEQAFELGGKITALRKELTNLAQEKTELLAKIDTLNAEIERQESNNLQIQGKLKNDNVILKSKVKALNTEKKILEEKVSSLADENIGLTGKFNEIGVLLKNKVAEIEGLKNKFNPGQQDSVVFNEANKSVELTPITVHPASSVYKPDEVPFIGKVLAVNRENSFVVINLGQDTGVIVGNKFLVYRDDKEIAALEVIQIRSLIAACDIIKESRTIKVGDQVKLSEK